MSKQTDAFHSSGCPVKIRDDGFVGISFADVKMYGKEINIPSSFIKDDLNYMYWFWSFGFNSNSKCFTLKEQAV